MDYDKSNIAEIYDSGRGYRANILRDWATRISDNIQSGCRVSTILDLGCGTGRFSSTLAEYFDADVEAIDPSAKMLEQAVRKPHARVRFQRARGEALPLADESVDLIFISMVFHHFDSPGSVALECGRVLRSGGSLCVRTGTVEQIPTYPYVPFFAKSRSILQTDIPTRASIESVFGRADFRPMHHELVVQGVASSWEAYVTRLSHRADSILAQLSDSEFNEGLTALKEHARSRPDAGPVTEPIDFFVFRYTGNSSEQGPRLR